MNKKLLVWAITAIAMGMSLSAAAFEPTTLGSKHTYGALGPGTEQTVTVMSDGSIKATFTDNGLVSSVQMMPVGNDMAIVRHDPWGVSTSFLNHDKVAATLAANPMAVAANDRFRQMLAKFTPAGGSIVNASGGPCGTQATNMINAGYAAIAACSGGMGLGCVLAENDYENAIAAYNNCINAAYPPKGGN